MARAIFNVQPPLLRELLIDGEILGVATCLLHLPSAHTEITVGAKAPENVLKFGGGRKVSAPTPQMRLPPFGSFILKSK